jgi:RNA polymerase sigma factor (sigma-70 family)
LKPFRLHQANIKPRVKTRGLFIFQIRLPPFDSNASLYKARVKLIEPTAKFWETAYSQNIGKMIGICYRYTSDRSLSEDLAHDAFLKAIDKSASFEGKGCFEAWLRRIVVNHVLQYIRDQKRRKYMDDWKQLESVSQPEEDNMNTHLSGQLEFSEQELLDAINELPEHHRLVFNLYVIDNFTHTQIGEELGISPGTSKSHLARARKKIKQILEERSGKKRERKRTILFFFLWHRRPGIDQHYSERFSNFEMPPERVLSPDFSEAPAIRAGKPLVNTSWYYMTAASVAVILTAVFITFHSDQQRNSIHSVETNLAQSTIHNEDKDPVPVLQSRDEIKEREAKNDCENNSHVAGSNAATIFPNSVILKNIKTKSMKNLDSLGVMLLMSSSIIFDTTAQSNHKEDVSVSIGTTEPAREIHPVRPVETNGSPAAREVKSKRGRGTFSASSLFWSAKDNELYLKGRIHVEFGKDKFDANGSCCFLGPVYLLIIDDKPVEHDSSIKLSDGQYHLVRLSNTEATEKYGESGRQGAIEISEVK